MTGLDCPMQTKALHLFWHKAELRLVEQPAPEAPVFAMSRPTLFGGREEFLLQYPARLEPPTVRDIARHRFTVRHGKKRRSFQAPDAATFETWLSALEQALEPKTSSEPEHSPTPSSMSSNATTAVSSQGKMSTPGSTGTCYSSSRGKMDTAGSNLSSQRSNVSSQPSHASTARAPPQRLTLEWPCFTRDRNNLKLIWLHRPAWAIPSAAKADNEADDGEQDASVTEVEEEAASDVTDEIEFGEEALQDVSGSEEEEEDNDVLSVFTDEEALDDDTHETDTVSAEDEFDYCDLETITDDEGLMLSTAVATSPVNTFRFEELVGMVPRKADHTPEAVVVAKVELSKPQGTGSANSRAEDVAPEVQAVLEILVDAVDTQSSIDEAVYVGLGGGVEPESQAAAEALVPALTNPSVDDDEASDVVAANEDEVKAAEADMRTAPESPVTKVSSPEDYKEGIASAGAVVSPATPRSSKKRSVVNSSKRCASIASKYKWVPLDPTNSSLIWVRGSADAGAKSTT